MTKAIIKLVVLVGFLGLAACEEGDIQTENSVASPSIEQEIGAVESTFKGVMACGLAFDLNAEADMIVRYHIFTENQYVEDKTSAFDGILVAGETTYIENVLLFELNKFDNETYKLQIQGQFTPKDACYARINNADLTIEGQDSEGNWVTLESGDVYNSVLDLD